MFACDKKDPPPQVEQPSGMFEEWAGREPQYYVTNLAIHGVISEHDLNTGVVKVVKEKWNILSVAEKAKAIVALQAEQDNNVEGIPVTIVAE
tara:strand:+ start:383 stop:658 length:276 start_codon:yes stop_codon:yes gene_type:complete